MFVSLVISRLHHHDVIIGFLRLHHRDTTNKPQSEILETERKPAPSNSQLILFFAVGIIVCHRQDDHDKEAGAE